MTGLSKSVVQNSRQILFIGYESLLKVSDVLNLTNIKRCLLQCSRFKEARISRSWKYGIML
jgi:hypothetical protein